MIRKRDPKPWFFLLIAAHVAGCGFTRQLHSNDLKLLCTDYGAATIPGRDELIEFRGDSLDDDQFAKAYRHLVAYGGIRQLAFRRCPIGDGSISLLLQFDSLEMLAISQSAMTVNGLNRLGQMTSLKELQLFEEDWSEVQIEEIRRAMPNVRVRLSIVR